MRFSIIARINCNQQLTVREWKINFLVANSIIVGCRGLKMDIFEKSQFRKWYAKIGRIGELREFIKIAKWFSKSELRAVESEGHFQYNILGISHGLYHFLFICLALNTAYWFL